MSYSSGESPRGVSFSDCFDRLPADAPAKHAHIIDLSTYDFFDEDTKYELKIQDAVATMLFNIFEDVLRRFLNGYVQSFQIVQEFGSSHTKLVIWRQGNKVMVGHYFEHRARKLFEWDNLVYCYINFDGSWKVMDACFGKYTSNLEGAWASLFVDMGLERGHPIGTKKAKLETAGAIAEYIMANECWNANMGSTWAMK